MIAEHRKRITVDDRSRLQTQPVTSSAENPLQPVPPAPDARVPPVHQQLHCPLWVSYYSLKKSSAIYVHSSLLFVFHMHTYKTGPKCFIYDIIYHLY